MRKKQFDKQAKNKRPRGNPNWQKGGPSPNPSGRPKSRTISEWYRHWLTEPSTNDPERTRADVIAERQTANAELGDLAAVKEITDRVEGRPRQGIDMSVDDKRQTALQSILAGLVATGMTEDEAKEYLGNMVPEVREWIH